MSTLEFVQGIDLKLIAQLQVTTEARLKIRVRTDEANQALRSKHTIRMDGTMPPHPPPPGHSDAPSPHKRRISSGTGGGAASRKRPRVAGGKSTGGSVNGSAKVKSKGPAKAYDKAVSSGFVVVAPLIPDVTEADLAAFFDGLPLHSTGAFWLLPPATAGPMTSHQPHDFHWTAVVRFARPMGAAAALHRSGDSLRVQRRRPSPRSTSTSSASSSSSGTGSMTGTDLGAESGEATSLPSVTVVPFPDPGLLASLRSRSSALQLGPFSAESEPLLEQVDSEAVAAQVRAIGIEVGRGRSSGAALQAVLGLIPEEMHSSLASTLWNTSLLRPLPPLGPLRPIADGPAALSTSSSSSSIDNGTGTSTSTRTNASSANGKDHGSHGNLDPRVLSKLSQSCERASCMLRLGLQTGRFPSEGERRAAVGGKDEATALTLLSTILAGLRQELNAQRTAMAAEACNCAVATGKMDGNRAAGNSTTAIMATQQIPVGGP